MRNSSTPTKVSICKKDVCVNVYGDMAKAVAITLAFAAAAYGVSQLVKALR